MLTGISMCYPLVVKGTLSTKIVLFLFFLQGEYDSIRIPD
jgi:hypothetical protein